MEMKEAMNSHMANTEAVSETTENLPDEALNQVSGGGIIIFTNDYTRFVCENPDCGKCGTVRGRHVGKYLKCPECDCMTYKGIEYVP